MSSQICIVIPCYNEEQRLDLPLFEAYLQKEAGVSFAFVNDGSKDQTLELIQAFESKWPTRAKAIDLTQNSGKAEAVRQGMLKVLEWKDFEYVGFFDADLATPLSQIKLLLHNIRRHPQYVMAAGSRVRRLGSQINRKPRRHYLGRIFATVVSLMLGISVYDTQCGAKLFAVSVIPELFDQPFVTKWLFDVEIFARLGKMNGGTDVQKVAIEVPLECWVEVGGSKINVGTFLKAPADLFRIYRKYKPLKPKLDS